MKRTFLQIISLVCTTIVFTVSCDPPVKEISSNSTFEFEFDVYNGWGAYTGLKISDTGLATLVSSYPELNRKLDDSSFNHILNMINTFKDIDYEYEFFCNDVDVFTMTLIMNGEEKSISIDACAFNKDLREQSLELIELKNIASTLRILADDIYENDAPWRGLETEFSINKLIVDLGEVVQATYTITNPTPVVRELWFRKQEKVFFNVNGFINNNNYSFYSSRNSANEEDNPSILRLEPEESIDLYYRWNQLVIHRKDTISAIPGFYQVSIGLLSGDFVEERATIEIIADQ